MYWKISEYKDSEGNLKIVYNYFDFISVTPKRAPYWNGILRQIVYPETEHLIIKAIILSPKEDPLEKIKKNKNS